MEIKKIGCEQCSNFGELHDDLIHGPCYADKYFPQAIVRADNNTCGKFEMKVEDIDCIFCQYYSPVEGFEHKNIRGVCRLLPPANIKEFESLVDLYPPIPLIPKTHFCYFFRSWGGLSINELLFKNETGLM